MNLTTDRAQGISIIRVNETRLTYPVLAEFTNTVSATIDSGDRVLLDLSNVT